MDQHTPEKENSCAGKLSLSLEKGEKRISPDEGFVTLEREYFPKNLMCTYQWKSFLGQILAKVFSSAAEELSKLTNPGKT